MKLDQEIFYRNANYNIISVEKEIIVHPSIFDLIPFNPSSFLRSYGCTYHIEGYQLYLDTLDINEDDNVPQEKGIKYDTKYSFQGQPVYYTGSILIGNDMIKEYPINDEEYYCFSYKNVYELIFEEGILITSIDHSKSMQRIRRNLDMGLRNLCKKRDYRCILKFIRTSFVGNYKFVTMRKKRRYIEQLKKKYNNLIVPYTVENNRV